MPCMWRGPLKTFKLVRTYSIPVSGHHELVEPSDMDPVKRGSKGDRAERRGFDGTRLGETQTLSAFMI